jgi:hypothetical protein
MRVNWEPLGGVGGKVLVEFSADPEFPKNAVVSVTANSSRRRATLSSDQARRVGEMAAVGTGGVYWRVIGTGRQGKQIRSQTFYVNVTD